MAGLYIHVPFCAKRCLYCAYPLAPFAGKARKKEVDARLRFLKAFWLSSDTLSGRHTAEKEAVQVALDNLTGNSGLGNLDTRWFKKKVW